jgi:GntR family transcriptional regulator
VIERRTGRALYRQLAEQLRNDIRSGALPQGQLLPSEQRIGTANGLCRPAVRRALDLLRDEGLITTTRGRRAQVRESQHWADPATVCAWPPHEPP